MNRFWIFCGLILSGFWSLNAFSFSHAGFTNILKKYQTSAGRIKYQALKTDAKKDDHPFNVYLNALLKVSHSEFNTWNKKDQMAFLINAYNALTIKLIIAHYPVKSIKDIGSLLTKPWDVSLKSFAGGSLLSGKIDSIDPIEHEWLRPKYKDYRIHAAVNCASISCPPLRNEAFVGGRLDAQLDDQMSQWLKDSTRNRYDSKTNTLHISKIFDWYEDDFKAAGGVLKVIEKHGPPEAKALAQKKGEIEYMNYDWGLNDS